MIDWSTAPVWAQWHGIDGNGEAHWFEFKPAWNGKRWQGLHPQLEEQIQRCMINGGTPGTLTKRPDLDARLAEEDRRAIEDEERKERAIQRMYDRDVLYQ